MFNKKLHLGISYQHNNLFYVLMEYHRDNIYIDSFDYVQDQNELNRRLKQKRLKFWQAGSCSLCLDDQESYSGYIELPEGLNSAEQKAEIHWHCRHQHKINDLIIDYSMLQNNIVHYIAVSKQTLNHHLKTLKPYLFAIQHIEPPIQALYRAVAYHYQMQYRYVRLHEQQIADKNISYQFDLKNQTMTTKSMSHITPEIQLYCGAMEDLNQTQSGALFDPFSDLFMARNNTPNLHKHHFFARTFGTALACIMMSSNVQ